MTLYARSDVMSVSIPAEGGGCGNGHSRPVHNGSPIKLWGLTCHPCEQVLRQDIVRDIGYGKKDGSHQRHEVGMWSENSLHLPKTPDELELSSQYEREGKQQLAREANARAEQSIRDWHTREDAQLQEYSQQQRMAEMLSKMEQMEAEMQRLRAAAGDPAALPVAAQPLPQPEPSVTWQDLNRASTSATATTRVMEAPQVFKGPAHPDRADTRPSAEAVKAGACPECGGPRRVPGARGPTPRVCLNCRQKEKS